MIATTRTTPTEQDLNAAALDAPLEAKRFVRRARPQWSDESSDDHAEDILRVRGVLAQERTAAALERIADALEGQVFRTACEGR